mgnify:CR=1 FL=1
MIKTRLVKLLSHKKIYCTDGSVAVDRITWTDRSDCFHWKNDRPDFDASDEF